MYPAVPSRITIAIVDDNLVDIDLARRCLLVAEPSAKIESFRGGQSFLKHMIDRPELKGMFDLLLLDLKMPGKDGFEVLKMIRKFNLVTCPVVLFSSSRHPDEVQRGLELGAAEFCEKPIGIEENITLLSGLVKKYCLERVR